jgi:hypothetical protein
VFGVTEDKEIINVDSEDHNTGGITVVVYAIFTVKASEAPSHKLVMEGFVPNAATLLHSI